MRRLFFITGLLLILFLTCAGVKAWVPGGFQTEVPNEEDFVILEMRYGREVLDPGLFAYNGEQGVTLPLSAITQALGFAIEVQPGEGIAQGWFFDESRQFSLDLAKSQVYVKGKPGPFRQEEILGFEEDIFVRPALLEAWFSIELKVSMSWLRLDVASAEPLPFEKMRARRRQGRMLSGQGGVEAGRVDFDTQKYRWWALPAIDPTLKVTYASRTESEANLHVAGRGDLLKMNADWAFDFEEEAGAYGIRNIQFLLERKNPMGRVFPWLPASFVRLGRLATPGIPWVTGGGFGYGLEFGNAELFPTREFDQTQIAGKATPGWDVQLFRNDSLIAFSQIGEKGEYFFDEVPLFYGYNRYKLVFHGPQGQIREETITRMIGSNMVKPGRHQYRFGVYRPSKDGYRSVVSTGEVAQESEALRSMVTLDYLTGLSETLGAGVGFVRLPGDSGPDLFGHTSLHSSWLGFNQQVQLIANSEGGTAAILKARGRLWDRPFTLNYAHFQDFESPDLTRYNEPVSQWLGLNLNTLLKVPGAGPVTGNWQIRALDLESGQQLSLDARLSGRVGRLNLSHRLNWELDREARGELLANGIFAGLVVRGDMGYRLGNGLELERLSLSGEKSLGGKGSLSGRLTHASGQGLGVSAGLNRDFRRWRLGVQGQWSSSEFKLGFTMSSFLRREPRQNTWRAGLTGASDQAAVSARVFLDRNGNGTFDEDEAPLPGAVIGTNDHTALKTDEQGIAFYSGLPAYRLTEVALSEAMLDNPAWIAGKTPKAWLPRPGSTWMVDLPVIEVGELEGFVKQRAGEKEMGIANIRILLRDSGGKVIAETRSAYDGYFLFEKLLPGTYQVQPDPAQMNSFSLARIDADEVAVVPDRISDVAFMLEPLPETDRSEVP